MELSTIGIECMFTNDINAKYHDANKLITPVVWFIA